MVGHFIDAWKYVFKFDDYSKASVLSPNHLQVLVIHMFIPLWLCCRFGNSTCLCWHVYYVLTYLLAGVINCVCGVVHFLTAGLMWTAFWETACQFERQKPFESFLTLREIYTCKACMRRVVIPVLFQMIPLIWCTALNSSFVFGRIDKPRPAVV